MPSLSVTTWTATNPSIPWVWKCSECDSAFSLGTILHLSPTKDQIAHINCEFEAHCKEVHPQSPIVQLDLPTSGERSQ
jgi:hypothetical protein